LSAPGTDDSAVLCTTALEYAGHLKPFARYLHADGQLQALIMSLIHEMPQTAQTASMLAQLLPEVKFLEQKTKKHLHHLLEKWQTELLTDSLQVCENENTSVVGTPCNSTLAAAYYENVREHRRQVDMKQQTFGAYHEKLFAAEDGKTEDLFIGSRPFESCSDYLVCLDMFYSVSFVSCTESESAASLPLIDAYASEVREAQLGLLSAKITKRPKYMRNISIQSSFHPVLGQKSDIVKNTVCPVPKVLLNMNRNGLNVADFSGLFNSSTENQNTNDVNFCAPQPNLNQSVKATNPQSFEIAFNKDSSKPKLVNYLPESVQPLESVTRLKFDGDVAQAERLAEWLSRWAERPHYGEANHVQSSAIKVQVSPQLLAYSLWLIDSCQHFTPGVTDITVAVVHGRVPASVPREPLYPSTLDDRGTTASSASGQFCVSVCVPVCLLTRVSEIVETCNLVCRDLLMNSDLSLSLLTRSCQGL